MEIEETTLEALLTELAEKVARVSVCVGDLAVDGAASLPGACLPERILMARRLLVELALCGDALAHRVLREAQAPADRRPGN
jgi:hypothetical protein